MTNPVTLSAAAALKFATTSKNPIIVNDTGGHIAINADALVKLGSQLVQVIDNSEANGGGGFLSAVSVADVLALASKTFDYNLTPLQFSNVVDSAQNVASNTSALLKISSQITGLTVKDTAKNFGTSNQSLFSSLGSELTNLVIDGATFKGQTTVSGSWAFNSTAAATAKVFANGLTASTLQVTDSGANIAANADALAKLGSSLIQVVDNNEYSGNGGGGFQSAISVADVLTLASKTVDYYGNVMHFANVVDSAQDVATNTSALLKISSQITGLTVNDTAKNFNTSNLSLFLSLGSELTNLVIDGVTFQGQTTVSGSWAFNSTAAAVAKVLANGLTASVLQVTDSGANIAANADALAKLGSSLIQVVDNNEYSGNGGGGFQSAISVADVLALASKTVDYYGNVVRFANVVDSAQNVAINTSALLKISSQITGLTVNDTAKNIASQAQIFSLGSELKTLVIDKTAFQGQAAINGTWAINLSASAAATLLADGMTTGVIQVTDSGANIAVNADALAKLGSSLIQVVDNTEFSGGGGFQSAISVADVLAIAPKTYDINNSVMTFANVVDSAQNVITNLDKLQSIASQITGIALNDASTPMLNLTNNQYTNDLTVLRTIDKPFKLVISNVSIANMASVLANSASITTATSSIIVTDSAANILANLNLGLLQTEAKAGQLAGIVFTDSGTPNLALTAIQFATNSAALAQLSSICQLTVSGVIMDNFATTLATPIGKGIISSMSVIGTAAKVFAGLDKLQANIAKISTITLTDTVTANITISGTQALADLAALKLITGNYHFSLTSASVSLVTALVGNSYLGSFTLSDSASNIAANLDVLQSLITKISSITLTDSGSPTLTITASQLSNDSGVLKLLGSSYHLAVSGVSVANLNTVLANNHVVSVTLADGAANISANLDSLQALHATQISGISLTDVGLPALAISAAQMVNDAQLISKLTGSYSLVVSGVTTANISSILANAQVAPVALSDTGSAIQSNLDTLETNVNRISSIILTDSKPPVLTLTATQLVNDATVLAKITGNYQLAVTPITANALSNAVSNSHVITPIMLTDNGNNVFSVLDTVQNNLSKIGTIKFTDTTKPAVTLTASQYVNDSNALAKINANNNYQLTVTGEAVANLSKDLSDAHISMVNLTDSAAHFQASLANLLTNAAKIGAITLTDTSLPKIAITGSQYALDTSVLAKISSPYSLTISNESASSIIVDVANSHVTSISVSDTAARIINNLPNLENQLSKIGSITLTDSSRPTLSLNSYQISTDSGALNDIQSPYLLTVNDSSTAINSLNLSAIHNSAIELMPTSLSALTTKSPLTLTENTTITDLNLSLINLSGDSINEKVYNVTGTEIDIVNSKGTVINQLLFTHDTEAQLQLVGVNSAIVHLM